MGTYTTNKNLFMPSVGEQGWGTLVNGNFETIDNFLKPITVSGSTYTFTGNHVGNQSGGSISATGISNSGTLTNTGKITANGGIGTTSLTTSSTITSTGKITANGGIGTKALTATSISNSGNMTNTGTLTSTGKIYANGGIEGVVESATQLNKDVVVTPTNVVCAYDGNVSINLCPYIPGITYSGSITAKTYYSDNSVKLYTWDSSGTMSTQTISTSYGGGYTTLSFSNVICAQVYIMGGNQALSHMYLPSFSS